MILDMFKKKNEENEVAKQEQPVVEATPKTPEQIAREEQFAKAKLKLEKLERLIRQMYDNKKDCYMVLAKDTTLDELATKEHLRPLISALNPKQRLPVLRFATTEAVAGDIAKAFGSVCEERPLVAKVPFQNLFHLLNNITKGGVFLYVVTDGPDTYVDQTVHMGYYIYKNILDKDPKGYVQYMSVLESLHALRVTKMPFYILPTPSSTEEDIENKTFQIGLVGKEKDMTCPVFGSKKIAEKVMEKWGLQNNIVPVSPVQLIEKLEELKVRCQGKDFPIFFGGVKGGEMVSADRFIGLVNELFALTKDK